MKKSFAAILVLALILASTLPAARSASRVTSVYAPPPPVSSTPGPPPTESRVTGNLLLDTPLPDNLSPSVDTVRAQHAIKDALEKHLRYWGPRYQVSPVEVIVEGKWAYGVARWKNVDQVTEDSLHILAHRTEDGVWQSLLPSQDGLYLQWVEEMPASLISTSTRQSMYHQAAKADRLGQSLSTRTDLPSDATPTSALLQDNAEYKDVQSMRNPAAIYCSDLGYEYEIVQGADGGHQGICRLPNHTSCDAWDFFQGRCGQEYNACARKGLKTVTQPNGDNPFSRATALCVDADGQKVTSAVDAVNLVEKLIGNTLSFSSTHSKGAIEPSSTLEMKNLTTPLSFDWRNYDGSNWMTPIKDQGICGSCWAFAAVGVAEAVTNIGYRDHTIDPDMSEQYLVTDCAIGAGDCAGGWGPSALAYIRDNGVPDEACLPYHDGDSSTGCTYDSNGCVAAMCTYCSDNECSDYRCSDRCSNWASRLYSLERINTLWSPLRDDLKTTLLAHGPLAVSIYMGGSFDANGVYRCTGPPYTNHGVSIVGYNDAGGYWIVRNSWGSSWNGDGYFQVAYDNCLIEEHFTYADLVACNDANEINDSVNFATSIAYGQTTDADICASGDEDFYQFTGATGDKVVVDIDAQSEGSALDSYIYLLDSDGTTVLAQNDDEGSGSSDSHLSYGISQDSTYYIRVRDYGDEGGADHAYSIHLLTDAITPTAEIASPESDSWINPITQTITANVSDGESGIRNVRFYWHDADWNTDWVILGEDWRSDDGWSYDFDSSVITEQVGSAFFIYAFDWAGNYASAASWNLGIDRTPPNVTLDAYPTYDDAPFGDFWVNWQNSSDNLSGIAIYDVQVRDGALGAWTNLVISTTETYTRFVGFDGHTYYFRARAQDYASNLSAYSADNVSHTVDICDTAADAYEADDSINNASWITPDGFSQIHNVHIERDIDWVKFEAQAGVTYTLSTGNTGDHADTVLELYDTDGSTLLISNDDCPGRWPASCLDWQPTSDGVYYAQIYHWNPWAYGCTTEYGLSVLTNRAPSLELGEPGLSFQYTQTLGVMGEPYPPDAAHLNWPHSVAVDSDGNLYVTEVAGHRSLKFNSNGVPQWSVGIAGLPISDNDHLNHPLKIAVDSINGRVYVADTDAQRVQVFGINGNYIETIGVSGERGSDNDHFRDPKGVAVDTLSNLYVADTMNHRIQIFDFTGAYSATLSAGQGTGDDQFNEPESIAFDSTGDMYVADFQNHRVQVFTPERVYSTTLGVTAESGDDDAHFDHPNTVVVDEDDNVYIVDHGNQRVQKFDRNLNYLATLGETGVTGSDNAHFRYPSGAAVDPNTGHIYVADSGNYRVQKFTSDLAHLSTIGATGVPYQTDTNHFNRPVDVATDGSGNIFLVEENGHRLLKLSHGGALLASIGTAGIPGDDSAHLDVPFGLAVTSSGRVYVADRNNHRVQILDNNLNYLATIGSGECGNGDDELCGPHKVSVDSSGNVYVADTWNERVQVFDSNYNYVATLGVTGTPDDDNTHFREPRGVAVDGEGNIYVADLGNVRIQKCTLAGSSGICTTFAGQTGVTGDAFNLIHAPLDVAVDALNRVYVCDSWWNQRIQVFDSSGAYLSTVGGDWGEKSGQFRNPGGIGVGADGSLYVADTENTRIQTFVPGVPDWTQANINGFGYRTSYIVSALASFDGQLYAGIYNPNTGAQLWRQSPGAAWEAIFINGLGDVNNVAVDHLIEFGGYLYAGTWNETNGGSNGGQIWRSATGSSSDWQMVASGGFTSTSSSEIFRFVVFNDQLYAATWNPTTGGELWRSNNGNSGTWMPVMTEGLGDTDRVFVSQTEFDGRLYVGTDNSGTGTTVWRSDTGDSGSWSQVNTDGFGDPYNQSVTLSPFNGYLYAGTYNYSDSDNPGAELWRCQRCDGTDWEQTPVADGFGDTENRGIRSLIPFGDALYAFTYNRTAGMQAWHTVDGVTWEQVGPDGLGDSNNYSPYWDNSVAVFDDRLHVGTWNLAHGGEVWQTMLQLSRADFGASPTQGAAPLTVDFTNLSTGDYDTCTWRFGDGERNDTCGNPSHEYEPQANTLKFPIDGVYTVTLTVSGIGGVDTLTRTHYITTYKAVRAGFSASPTTGTIPLPVTFTNQSMGAYDTCIWNFGDGATSSDCLDPTHTYTTSDIYTVTLAVSGLGGTDTLTRTRYLTVYETVQADFGATPTSGPSPLTVEFTNLSTGSYDTCLWDLGDGTINLGCANLSHVYIPDGGTLTSNRYIYTVTLTVQGIGGRETETKQSYITVIDLHKVHLPLVVRRWPPVPYQPTLNTVQDTDYGDYVVSWTEHPSRLADTYTLQEATSANFTDNLREICTTSQQSCLVVDKEKGTYYYQVRGQNQWGYGKWSETQAVKVPYLKERVTKVTITLPQPLAQRGSSWCTWRGCSLSPRLYHEPLADDRTLIGWTDSNGTGHVSMISGSNIQSTFDFPGASVGGLVAHNDASFAVLLWYSDSNIMRLSRRDQSGNEIWTTNINSDIALFNSWLGGSRLTFGNSEYVAYFTVKGVEGAWPAGHYGDQLTHVDEDGNIQSGGWDWGCSHSMAQLVNYHPDLDKFMAVCSSDCYPGKGIFINHNEHQVFESDGNCGGLVSVQLGQTALAEGSWKLLFNALGRTGYAGHGIALTTIDENYQSNFMWLTNTNGEYERDPVIARLGNSLQSNRYVVGWKTINDDVYWLGVIDGSGNFLAGPEKVSSAGIAWGNRDDSFRTRTDGRVSWVQGNTESTLLYLFYFD